jgi:hypothetical protein
VKVFLLFEVTLELHDLTAEDRAKHNFHIDDRQRLSRHAKPKPKRKVYVVVCNLRVVSLTQDATNIVFSKAPHMGAV